MKLENSHQNLLSRVKLREILGFAVFIFPMCSGFSGFMSPYKSGKEPEPSPYCRSTFVPQHYRLFLNLTTLFEGKIEANLKFLRVHGVAEITGKVFRKLGAKACSSDSVTLLESQPHKGLEIDRFQNESYIFDNGEQLNFDIYKVSNPYLPKSYYERRDPYGIQFAKQISNDTELFMSLPFRATLFRQGVNKLGMPIFGAEDISVKSSIPNLMFMGSIFPAFTEPKFENASVELIVNRPYQTNANVALFSNQDRPVHSIVSTASNLVTYVYPVSPLKNLKILVFSDFLKTPIVQNVLPNTQVNVWTPNYLDADLVEHTAAHVGKLVQYYAHVFGQTQLPSEHLEFVLYLGDHVSSNLVQTPGVVMMSIYAIQPSQKVDDKLPSGSCAMPVSSQVASLWMPPVAKEYDTILAQYLGTWATRLYDKLWMPSHCSDCYPPDEVLFLEMLEQIFSRKTMVHALTEKGRTSLINYVEQLQNSIEYFNQTHLLPENGAVSVQEVYSSWDNHWFKPPKIHVSLANPPENPTNSIVLSIDSKRKYTWMHHQKTSEEWWVPVKVLTENGQDFWWISPPAETNKTYKHEHVHTSPVINTEKWLVLNPDNSGLYSVNYSNAILERIATQLVENHTVIPELAREQLLKNQAFLMDSTWITQQGFLELLQYMKQETSLKVFKPVVVGITKVFATKDKWNADLLHEYVSYFSPILDHIFERVGVLEPESRENCLKTWLRKQLWENCLLFRIPYCLKFARQQVESGIAGTNAEGPAIQKMPNIPDFLDCAAVQYGPLENATSDRVVDFFLKNYTDGRCYRSNTPVCKNAAEVLACTTDVYLMKEFLESGKFDKWESEISTGILRQKPDSVEILLPLYTWWKQLLLSNSSVTITHKRFVELVNSMPEAFVHDYISEEYPNGIAYDAYRVLKEHKEKFPWKYSTSRIPSLSVVSGTRMIANVDKILQWFKDNQ